MTGSSRRLAVWGAGAAAALAVLGPAVAGGPFVTLDLVVFDEVAVPEGLWGLGTELPRALPVWVVVGVLDPLLGVLLAAAVTVGFAGAARLARLGGAGVPTQVLAGALYALSPFVLTRLGAGHLGVVTVMAVLPWAAPWLVHPARSGARTLLWSAGLAAGGLVGGLYGGVLVAVGWWRDGRRRPVTVAGAFVLAQLPWLVPAVVAWAASPPDPAGVAGFGTDLDGPAGPLQLVAGDGFWREADQVGPGGAASAVAGVGLLMLAAAGWRRLPGRRAGLVVAAVGFAVALWSAVPGLRSLHEALSETVVGAPLRESQRLLGLALVGVAPAAALGAKALGRGAGAAAVALAAVLAVPGLGAVDGRLDPVEAPASWDAARRAVRADPGTVLALPWHRYLDVSFAGGRRALHPLVGFLGGDVVTSSDPELDEAAWEAGDAREPFLTGVVDRIENGAPAGDDLARAGVRWVALAHEADWRRWSAGLAGDASLEPVVRGDGLDLYRVEGRRVERPHRHPLPWLASFRGEAVWGEPWAAGWVGARRTPEGLVGVPGGGTVWFWPALPVAGAHLLTGAAVVLAALRVRRRPGPPPGAPTTATPGTPPPG